jgi:D-alanyl-D-alanine dipeptidase
MERSGFHRYESEWWHYALADEPHPDTYFDFPIR